MKLKVGYYVNFYDCLDSLQPFLQHISYIDDKKMINEIVMYNEKDNWLGNKEKSLPTRFSGKFWTNCINDDYPVKLNLMETIKRKGIDLSKYFNDQESNTLIAMLESSEQDREYAADIILNKLENDKQ